MGTVVLLKVEPTIVERLLGDAWTAPGEVVTAADSEEVCAGMKTGQLAVDVLVMGGSVKQPVRVAQRVQHLDTGTGVLILREPREVAETQRLIQWTPLLKNEVRCLSLVEENLAPPVASFFRRMRQRRQYRAILARLQARLTLTPPHHAGAAERAAEPSREDLARELDTLKKTHWLLRKTQDVLPICMQCSRVKNEAEEWEDVTAYLRKHALFLSHGYCPECFKDVFPEVPR